MTESKIREKMPGFLNGVKISEFRDVTDATQLAKGHYGTASFLLIKGGRITCSLYKTTRECTGNDIFISNLFESYEQEIIEPLSGFSVIIEQEYLSGIVDGEKQFHNFAHVTSGLMRKLTTFLNQTARVLAEYNFYEKCGFVNYFIGLLAQVQLFTDSGKNRTDDLFARVKNYIDEHYSEELNLSTLAGQFGYSPKYFSSAFNKYFGVNLNSYINYVRVKKAIEMEKKMGDSYTINEVIYCSGFNSRETYYRALRKYKKDGGKLTAAIERHSMGGFKKKRAVVVGYGNRGQVYADYSLECPEELEIVGVVDPNPFKLQQAKERYGLKNTQLYSSLEVFIKARPACDFVVNSTMDQLHYQTSMALLNAGYHMLLEKPIVPTEKELSDLCETAKKNKCKVLICHVLRYTPYYKTMKKIIDDGEIGEIMTMEMNEHVCASHYLTSYDRGKWNNEAECGSGLLLAKSCHDMDLMCWLNDGTRPKKVVSLGDRALFIEEKMPEGASEYCYQCKYERTCQYSAIHQYMDLKVMPFLVWDKLDKPLDEITEEEKLEFLKKDNYGRCAYIAGKDLVDRQGVVVTFENGSCCTFMLVGGTTKAERAIRIIGTLGEIEGKLSEDKFTVRKYARDAFDGVAKTITFKDEILKTGHEGHNGGDFGIMHELIAYLNGAKDSVSITDLNDSVDGHLCVYAAEKARKEDKVVRINGIRS